MKHFGYKQFLLGITFALAVTGCAGGQQSPGTPSQGSQTPSAPGTGGGGQTETPKAKQLTIKTYYTDDNLAQLIERSGTISYEADEAKYKAALDALKTPPEAKLFSLSKGITYRSAAFQNGNVTIDLSIAAEGRLGAPGEELLLQSISKTLFQFSEVKTIEVLLDGKKPESLMGHVSLPHPIKRN